MDAFVDESCRTDGVTSCYLVAAVLVPRERADEVRTTLRGLLRPGQRTLHWHAENARRRPALAVSVARLGLPGVVVADPRIDRRNTERARRRCVTRLVRELDRAGVHRIVFESRERRRNEDDRRVIAAAQRAGHAGPGLRYSFALPTEEPLLWLPDVAAGAAGLALGRDEWTCFASFGEAVSLVTLP